MDEFTHIASGIVLGLFILGVVIYGLMLLLYWFNLGRVRPMFDSNPSATFGIPIAAAAAFAVVVVLSKASPEGMLKFTAFSLKFEGPSGPITLWVITYLNLIGSLKLLRRR